MPDYRRAVFFITAGGAGGDDDSDPAGWAEHLTRSLVTLGDSVGPTLVSGFHSGTTQTAPIPLYAFSTRGLTAPTSESLRSGRGGFDERDEALQTLARSTVGRAIVGTNAPEAEVSSVMEELSSYYVLAYESTYPTDGRLRRLSIDVTRRGAVVLPARTVFATPRADGRMASVAVARGETSGLVDVVAMPLPDGGLPLSLTSLPFPQPGAGRTVRLVSTLGLTLEDIAPGMTAVVDLDIRIFDGEGRRAILTEQKAMNLSVGDDVTSPFEVLVPVVLEPGRYSLRIAARRQSRHLAGSVYSTVIVPDFSRQTLSLTGVAIGRIEGRPIGGGELVEGLLPFAPTTVREFARSDRVGAMVRAFQRSGRAPSEVQLTTQVLDADGLEVVGNTRQLPAEAFGEGAGVEHRFEFPLPSLVPGDYLLRFVASAGPHREQRDVRFSVK